MANTRFACLSDGRSRRTRYGAFCLEGDLSRRTTGTRAELLQGLWASGSTRLSGESRALFLGGDKSLARAGKSGQQSDARDGGAGFHPVDPPERSKCHVVKADPHPVLGCARRTTTSPVTAQNPQDDQPQESRSRRRAPRGPPTTVGSTSYRRADQREHRAAQCLRANQSAELRFMAPQ
jgi:hypothetical protein